MQIRVKNARLSYPNLFKPRAGDEGKEPKYSACFILAKTDPQVAEIKALCQKVALEKFGGKIPAGLKQCLRDGAEKADTGGFDESVMFFNAASKNRPPVVGRQKEPLDGSNGRPYGGCYVNAIVDFYAINNPGDKGGKRVCCEVNAVQFWADGEPFGSAPVDAAKAFDAAEDDGEDLMGQ